MAVTVQFRGVVLFCTNDGETSTLLQDVRVPDCEDVVPPFGSKRGNDCFHLDGTLARPHYAGILVAMNGKTLMRLPLRGSQVFIGDIDGATPDVTEAIGRVADISSLVGAAQQETLELDPDAVPSATVTLGPSNGKAPAVSMLTSGLNFTLAGAEKLTLGLAFEYESSIQLTTRVNGIDVPVTIPDAATVFVYNFDSPDPDAHQLEHQQPPTEPFMVDHDFKWIYTLLRPKSGPLFAWDLGALPAPFWSRSAGIEARGIRVSTCFPGRIST